MHLVTYIAEHSDGSFSRHFFLLSNTHTDNDAKAIAAYIAARENSHSPKLLPPNQTISHIHEVTRLTAQEAKTATRLFDFPVNP
jgi:hypothetical protein